MTDQPTAALGAFNATILDAIVKNNLAAVKGFEQMSQYFFESTRKNFDLAIETNKRLASVTSLSELVDLQTKLSQEFFETVSERGKSASEMGATIVRDTAAQSGVPGANNGGIRRAPDAKGN
jgi:phasin family protein